MNFRSAGFMFFHVRAVAVEPCIDVDVRLGASAAGMCVVGITANVFFVVGKDLDDARVVCLLN